MDMVTIRGKRLYARVTGPENAPVLLYVHGGPGTGSYDFELHQGEALARHLRVIALDQRGVLRSDPLTETDSCTVQDLVEDIEALRLELGLTRWSLLGHSFGGILALRYALAYPQAVERLVFECPTFDIHRSARCLLQAGATLYDSLGDGEHAAECRTLAADAMAGKHMGKLMALGERREDLYVYGPDKLFFGKLRAASPFPEEYWGRANRYQAKLWDDPAMWQSLLPQFPELQAPALLLTGETDHVCSPDQTDAFLTTAPRTACVHFAHSGHFPRFEEPERYAAVVTEFVRTGRVLAWAPNRQ